MDPIAVDIRLIRAVLAPEVRIAPGRALMARVASLEAPGRGKLNIAGVLIDAKLPKEVRAGDELRLVVRHASSERVVLSLADPAAAPPSPAVPLPGGGGVRVSDEEAASATPSDRATHTLALRYDAPALGAIDLRFELDARSLRLNLALRPGGPLDLAQAAADELRCALASSLNRTVEVTVSPRHDPLDVYA